MPDPDKIESLLIADVGSVNTHAVLVDRVGDRFRFVALGGSPSTVQAPVSDAVVGVRRAVEQIEAGRAGICLTTTVNSLSLKIRVVRG